MDEITVIIARNNLGKDCYLNISAIVSIETKGNICYVEATDNRTYEVDSWQIDKILSVM